MSIWHRKAHLLALNIGKPDQQASPASIPTALPPPISDHDVLHDHAQDLLQNAPISEDQKAELWDHYHDSKDARELAGRLETAGIPTSVALTLLEAKKKAAPQSTADKIFETLMSIPKQTLDVAETHPKTLEHFTKAVRGKE